MSETRPQPYKVREIHVVAKGSDYYGLEGLVLVETRDPPARHQLGAGQSARASTTS